MKKILYLVTAALVAMLILVPSAMAAQTEVTMEKEVQMEGTQPLPASGGVSVGSASVVLPAAALLLGAGVLGVAVLRRR